MGYASLYESIVERRAEINEVLIAVRAIATQAINHMPESKVREISEFARHCKNIEATLNKTLSAIEEVETHPRVDLVRELTRLKQDVQSLSTANDCLREELGRMRSHNNSLTRTNKSQEEQLIQLRKSLKEIAAGSFNAKLLADISACQDLDKIIDQELISHPRPSVRLRR